MTTRTRTAAPALDRLQRRSTIRETGCWTWHGAVNSRGYGTISDCARPVSRIVLVHRFAYELLVGPIPEGLQIDHGCHNAALDCKGGVACPHRRCWRPEHLHAVTGLENMRRATRHAPRLGPWPSMDWLRSPVGLAWFEDHFGPSAVRKLEPSPGIAGIAS